MTDAAAYNISGALRAGRTPGCRRARSRAAGARRTSRVAAHDLRPGRRRTAPACGARPHRGCCCSRSTCHLRRIPKRHGARSSRRRSGARFDLEHGPLLRCTLVVLGPTRLVLIIVLHHIIADGWSIDVLTRELSAAVPGPRRRPAGGAAAVAAAAPRHCRVAERSRLGRGARVSGTVRWPVRCPSSNCRRTAPGRASDRLPARPCDTRSTGRRAIG